MALCRYLTIHDREYDCVCNEVTLPDICLKDGDCPLYDDLRGRVKKIIEGMDNADKCIN